MLLDKLEVRGFGCFQDREFTFSEGLNVVIGPNESGKSTLQQAIGAALFGFYRYRVRGKRPDAESRFSAAQRYRCLCCERYPSRVSWKVTFPSQVRRTAPLLLRWYMNSDLTLGKRKI